MAGYAKATRKIWAKTEITAFQLENLAATVAAEVVVMRFAGDLITKRFTGHGNRSEPVALEQSPNVAVDRGDAQTADFGLCGGQHFLRGKWPVRTLKCFSDRSFLTCVARLSGQCCPPNTE